MRASIETLCAVASVEEERLVLLDLGKLEPQSLDLPTSFQPDPGDITFEVANLPQTVLPAVEGLQFWTTP